MVARRADPAGRTRQSFEFPHLTWPAIVRPHGEPSHGAGQRARVGRPRGGRIGRGRARGERRHPRQGRRRPAARLLRRPGPAGAARAGPDRVRSVRVRRTGGRRSTTEIAYPPGYGAGSKLPVSLVLHGYAADESTALAAGDYPANLAAGGGAPAHHRSRSRPSPAATATGIRIPTDDPLGMIFDEFLPLLGSKGLAVDAAGRARLLDGRLRRAAVRADAARPVRRGGGQRAGVLALVRRGAAGQPGRVLVARRSGNATATCWPGPARRRAAGAHLRRAVGLVRADRGHAA